MERFTQMENLEIFDTNASIFWNMSLNTSLSILTILFAIKSL